MERLKIVFVGGLTNGKVVYDYLSTNKYVDLVMVITYPDEPPRPRHVIFPNNSVIIKDDSANKHIARIRELKPNLIIVAGWSEMLSSELISIPDKGTIGFHPSKLPYDRGRSVLAWQIEDGYTQTALSMFFYSEIPDAGEIIGQDQICICTNDYIEDVLHKVDKATYNLLRAYFPLVRVDKAPRKKQDIACGTFRRLRTERDSVINWDRNSSEVYNKVRAISRPYPGAEGAIDGLQAKIWRAKILNQLPFGNDIEPGTLVCRLWDNSVIVKTRDSFIQVVEWERI